MIYDGHYQFQVALGDEQTKSCPAPAPFTEMQLYGVSMKHNIWPQTENIPLCKITIEFLSPPLCHSLLDS